MPTTATSSSLALLLFFAVPLAATSPQLDPYAGPKPIAVLIETNPWAMVIGSDTPRVAVYETGEVIYLKVVGESADYRHFQLAPAAFSQLERRLGPVLALAGLKSFYDIAPGVTDQPRSQFYLRDGAHEATAAVYGLMAPTTRLPGYTSFPGAGAPDVLPRELLEIDDARSTTWIPSYLEVELWDYSYAPEASVHWPKDWPGLDTAGVKRGTSFSIFLPGSQLPRLRALLASRPAKGAVEVSGNKMMASYRYCFPGEPSWQSAFAQASAKAARRR